MKKIIDRLMAKLGYVPAAALDALAFTPLKIEIDTSQVSDALTLLEKVISVAQKAEVAVAAVSAAAGMPAPVPADGGLVLNELRAMRAELKSIREHSGARLATVTDRERFAHVPPPAGAKRGHWACIVGSAAPVWMEDRPMEYDPATGGVRAPGSAASEVAGLRI
ncbi:hypothetical protein [Duganella callida]|uniref:Uncharacterized protein n=1 Tax=Duganella callida TaxID=2561932 RepID=A0A4Y9S864_9BURK|nr:hypothetical protein [Duganella callida]TFW15933.1 hypothetical protein E4L98_24880 [Duganella callida]